MAFKLPRLKANLAIVSGQGKPLDYFLRFWNIDVAPVIERQESSQADSIAAIQEIVSQLQANSVATQAAQQAANDAQATADAATAGNTRSGAATNPSVFVSTGVWAEGPRVDLTGVVAGLLTISGSGPQQDGDVTMSGGKGTATFNFRIVEIIGMSETTVFTGSFTGTNTGFGLEPVTISNTSAGSVSTFSSSRTSTGDVSYRIDAISPGSRGLSDLLLYLFVRRAE